MGGILDNHGSKVSQSTLMESPGKYNGKLHSSLGLLQSSGNFNHCESSAAAELYIESIFRYTLSIFSRLSWHIRCPATVEHLHFKY